MRTIHYQMNDTYTACSFKFKGVRCPTGLTKNVLDVTCTKCQVVMEKWVR